MQPGFNFEPLTPSAFLFRAAHVFPDRVGVVQDDLKFTYARIPRPLAAASPAR